MATLTIDLKGNFKARKRLPDDVREAYGGLYGTKRHEATKLFSEWLAEIEGRIAAIRAARDWTGQSLTPQQARKLAGEWYDWFIARYAKATHLQVEHWREAVQEAIYSSGLSEQAAQQFDPDELWRDDEDVRESVRPVLADVGDTAQFLATKRLTLTPDARTLFLDFLYEDLGAALTRLLRISRGDYSLDKYRERFPEEAEVSDTGVTPLALFE